MSVLKIKNGQGNWVTIPTIKGERGHSPEVTATKTNGVTTISVDGTSIATINDGEDATLDVSADEYSTSDTYAVGDYCAYDGNLYKCTTAIETAEAWNPNHWTQITITDEIQTLKQDLSLKLDDVQINGTSVVTDGVANVPIASENDLGVIKVEAQSASGLVVDSTTKGLRVVAASSNVTKAGSSSRLSIVPYNQHESTFYGLAKAAGDSTQSASSNAVGTYTDDAKEKIHSMLNIADASAFGIVCNGETASQNIIKGQYVIWNGKLYIALVDISSGTTLSVGNLVAVNDGFFNAIALPKVYACYTAEEDMRSITLDFGLSYSFDVYDELLIVVYQSDTAQTSFCNTNWSYVYIKNNNNYAITQTSSLYFVGNQPNMIRLKRTPTGIFGNIINTTYSIKPIFVPKSADDELLISNILCNSPNDENLLLTGTRIEAFLGRM